MESVLTSLMLQCSTSTCKYFFRAKHLVHFSLLVTFPRCNPVIFSMWLLDIIILWQLTVLRYPINHAPWSLCSNGQYVCPATRESEV